MAKSILFKFRDGQKEVKVGDTVYWADSTMYVTAIGRLLITINKSMDAQKWSSSQFYAESGALKSEYSNGGGLFTSEEAYDNHILETRVINELLTKFRGNYGTVSGLTYDKACRILKILEE